jgi:pimeloyl-ACP methyl ester carboxylesterase
LQLLRGAAARTPPAVALESYESWTTLAFADEAATIDTPALVLAPAADRPMTPDATRERVARPLVGSRMLIVEDAGHYAIVEQPAWIAEQIERFVEEL